MLHVAPCSYSKKKILLKSWIGHMTTSETIVENNMQNLLDASFARYTLYEATITLPPAVPGSETWSVAVLCDILGHWDLLLGLNRSCLSVF
jgi:hypothetical protein